MKKTITIILLTLIVHSGFGQDIPPRPNPPRLVNDFTSILSKNEEEALESELVEFARNTSTQIVVATVKSLEGADIESYAFQLGEKWGIGQEGKDNGALIVLKPKTLNEKGEVFIATGYGLEHLIPDAVANRIVDFEMIPKFKQNDYYGGLAAGIKVMMDLTREEYTAEAYTEHVKSENKGKPYLFLIFLLFFVIIPLMRGKKGRHFSSRNNNLPLWIALGMLGSHRSSHGGSFGNFKSGGGSFGGFGGFGGGSFGGGGAGGSW